MQTNKQRTGAWGESIASSFLKKRGYAIVTKNYRVKRGELDIIAWHKKPVFGKTLCFVEVKTRSGALGSGERATTKEKIEHMQRAARLFCLERHIPIDRTPIQFEQISVYATVPPQIFWYEIPVS